MRLIESWVDCAPVQEDNQNPEFLQWLSDENDDRRTRAAAWLAANTSARPAPTGGVFSSAPVPPSPELPEEMKQLDANKAASLEAYNTKLREDQRASFPLPENMMALLFMVSAELNEQMRERLVSTLLQKEIRTEAYDTKTIEGIFRDLYASVNTSFADPFVNRKRETKTDNVRISCPIMENGKLQVTWATGFRMKKTYWKVSSAPNKTSSGVTMMKRMPGFNEKVEG